MALVVVFKQLTKELAAYCKQYKDPYAADPVIKAAMKAILAKE